VSSSSSEVTSVATGLRHACNAMGEQFKHCVSLETQRRYARSTHVEAKEHIVPQAHCACPATAAVSSCSKQALCFRAGAGQRPVGQHDLPTARPLTGVMGRLKTRLMQPVGRTHTRGSEARARWLMQVSTARAESSPPTLLPSSQAQGLSAHCWTRRPRGPQRLSPHAAA
jgi:hypothetical protein